MRVRSSYRFAPFVLAFLALAGWFGHRAVFRKYHHVETHLRDSIPLPFAPVSGSSGVAVHPDGRLFLMGQAPSGPQFLAISGKGEVLWNRSVPGLSVDPRAKAGQPVLVTSGLVLLPVFAGEQGPILHGFSLGGEVLFSLPGIDGSPSPCADEQGAFYAFDKGGALVSFTERGQERFRTSLGWLGPRALAILNGGGLVLLGAKAATSPVEAALATSEGMVYFRQPLPLPNEGPAQVHGISVGRNGTVLSAGRSLHLLQGGQGQLLRLSRIRLPEGDEAHSAATILSKGEEDIVMILSKRGLLGLSMRGEVIFRHPLPEHLPGEPGSKRTPVLTRDGRVVVPVTLSSPLLPDHHGLLSVAVDGTGFYFQELPSLPLGLHLSWDGGVVALLSGEKQVFRLETASATKTQGPYAPWPLGLGNPAGSCRTWPERP